MKKSITSVNVAVATGSLLLVIAWHWIATLHKPRLDKIAAELVSTIEFFGTPVPNHAGAKLFYAQTSANGVTGYVVDAASGKKTFLFEHEQSHLQGVGLLGWSPDDTLFAYSVRSPKGVITICDANSAGTLATVAESKIILGGVWLSDESFVYVNNNQDLSLIQKSGGDWHKSSLFTKKPAVEPNKPVVATTAPPATVKKTPVRTNPAELVQCLTAISEKTVAWQQGGAVWKYDLGSDAPVKIWESTTNALVNFCFSGERNCFTLHCKSAAGECLFDLYPAFIWRNERITGFEPITPPSGAITSSLTFIRNGLGYAYLAKSQTFDAIVIKREANSVPIQLAWEAGVDSLAANDNHVYITGSPTNGPLGIWDYDVKAGALSCAVSGLEHPFQHAGIVAATHEATTNADGEKVVYHLSPPVHFVAGRKYPLVISFNGVRWRPQEAAVPNAGCFLASLNGIPSDEADVVTVYQAAIQHPGIDASRVYVMGVSAGAGLAGRLLQDRPELWRGAILLSPVSFPDPSQLKVSRILIDSGGNDTYLKESGGVSKLTQFQDAAALAGIPVTLSINQLASHVYRSNIAEEERVRQTLEFLAED